MRCLAASCKFGDYIPQAIRDRLVCGLRSEGIQKRLLAEAELTLTKALEIAQSMEAADRNTQHLKQKGNSDPLRVSDIHRNSTHGSGSSARSGTHGEVDLINVFDVAVILTKATSVVTEKQCVMHVVRQAT